jgi:hypothetical protein
MKVVELIGELKRFDADVEIYFEMHFEGEEVSLTNCIDMIYSPQRAMIVIQSSAKE